ncbi:MAG TPA: YbaY family lipoprotein [Rhodanobacteraceae bacterium]|nr:YbaY family lipoprotein [Rhodanobacteraceae bacterium]
MRKFVVVPLLLAPLVLVGCGSSSQTAGTSASASASGENESSADAPVSAATAVTGTVALATPGTQIQPGAKLQLSLVDVTQQPGVTVNQQNVNQPQFPQAIHIPFTAGQINGNDIYVLQATMQANGRTWSTKLQQPVLTHGQGAKVALTLVPEPTPAEKMLEDFNQAKRQTGGMTVKSGTSSKIGESRSWQVFSDIHGVEFIIIQVNQTDKGFTKTEYAYHDGLPWVVVQTEMPKPDAPATSTTRVGWGGQEGQLVLNQLEQGGKTTTVSDAAAKALHQQAEGEYKKFANQH